MPCIELCSLTQELRLALVFTDENKRPKEQLVEYSEPKITAQAIADMVDPPEEGAEVSKTLVERLREAPQKIVGFLSDNAKLYIAHVLGLVKSYWPQAKLDVVATGVSAECSAEKFEEYTEELKPVAVKIVSSLEEQ